LDTIAKDIRDVIEDEQLVTPHLIHTKTGYNWRTVKKHLDALVDQGIVKGERIGHIFVYSMREGDQNDKN
jgi:predicted transcriptional regulator